MVTPSETAVLKLAHRAARTGIIAAKLLVKLLVSAHDADSPLDSCFRWITSSSLAGHLDERAALHSLFRFS